MGFLTEVESRRSSAPCPRYLGAASTGVRPHGARDHGRVGRARPLWGRWFLAQLARPRNGPTPAVWPLEVDINDTSSHHVRSRRLIIATPTGSPAYSSRIGPISPRAIAACCSHAVSPHMLVDGPLASAAREILPSPSCDDLSVVAHHRRGASSLQLAAGDTVSCRGGDRSAHIVPFGPRDSTRSGRASSASPTVSVLMPLERTSSISGSSPTEPGAGPRAHRHHRETVAGKILLSKR